MAPSNVEAAVLATVVADSHALGTHWVYDGQQLAALGDVRSLIDPLSKYHSNRKAGQNTQYGDQTLWLLEFLANEKKFDSAAYAKVWAPKMKAYDGYIDGASKDTLAALADGKPFADAGHDDFNPVARISPLLLLHGDDEAAFVAAAKLQTQQTHNNPLVIASTELVAHALFDVATKGTAPIDAIRAAAEATQSAEVKALALDALKAGDDGLDAAAVLKKYGISCNWDKGLALTLYLLAKNPDLSLEDALVLNASWGGDNSPRGMVIASLLAASKGADAIPSAWVDAYQGTATVKAALAKL